MQRRRYNNRRMACFRAVFCHNCCSTSTVAINHSTMKCVTSSENTIYVSQPVEETLGELAQYYKTNSLQINKEAKRLLKIKWITDLQNNAYSKYSGVTLGKTLSYKEHIPNTKVKVATRNNLLRKRTNSKW